MMQSLFRKEVLFKQKRQVEEKLLSKTNRERLYWIGAVLGLAIIFVTFINFPL